MRSNSISSPCTNEIEAQAGLRRSIFAFTLRSVAVLAVLSIIALMSAGGTFAMELFLYTMVPILLFSIFAGWRHDLFKRQSGGPVERFEAANILTAARLFLIPPVMLLLARGMVTWAVFGYCVILATDVADGWVARRFDQETVFGLMLDPFCDIASTFAMMTWLWMADAVPGWLYALLIVRYSEFFAGMVILKAMGRTPRLRATLPGKVAGVIQGSGIVILTLQKRMPGAFPSGWNIDIAVFSLMALAFLSVIFSQTLIGIEAVRAKRA